MKKTNFFGAKTLVAVALTSFMFTSCEEESMVINPQKPTELPAASAVVNAITIDAATGMEINATYNVAMPYSVAADASGNIAATSVDLVASAEGYYDATKAVAVPAVAKGQMVYIPTTLYATAIEAEVSVENPTIDETIADKIKDVQAIDDFTAGKSNTLTVNVPYGYRITNMEEVLADIEALTYADGRALTEESVMAVVKENLKKLAESMAEFKTKEHTIDIFIPDGTKCAASSNFARSISFFPKFIVYIPHPISTPTILGTTLSVTVIVVPMVHPFPACTSGIILILLFSVNS